MDPNNFVGASGSGYDVYVNGQKIGTYSNLDDAQNAFNSSGSQKGTGGFPASSATSLQDMLDALAAGDTQKFNEAVREFDASQAQQKQEFNQTGAENQRQYNLNTTENGRQFDTNTALKEQQDYGSLASNLLSTAASLRGPKDYYQYQTMLGGGKDLMSQLYGSQPQAAFGNKDSSVTPVSITDLMNQMGFKQAPQVPNYFWDPVKQNWFNQPAPPTSGSSPSTPDPAASNPPIFDEGGKVLGPQGAHILAILKVGEKVIPTGAGKNTFKVNTKTDSKTGLPLFDDGGLVGPPFKSPKEDSLTGATGATDPSASSSLPKYPSTATRGPVTTAGGPKPLSPSPAPAPPVLPRPYQINPAVFDSLGPTGQGLLQSAAEAAGWDWNDYLRQINAQRPTGVAPATSIYDYFMSPSARSSSIGMPGAY